MNSCGIDLYKNASPFSHRDKVLVKSAENQSKCRNIFVLVVLVSVALQGSWKTGRGDAHEGGVGIWGAARGQGLTRAMHVTPPPCDPAPVASLGSAHHGTLAQGTLTLAGCLFGRIR